MPTGISRSARSSRSSGASSSRSIGLPELAESGLVDGEEGRRTIAAVEAVLRTRTRAQWARGARRARRVRRARAATSAKRSSIPRCAAATCDSSRRRTTHRADRFPDPPHRHAGGYRRRAPGYGEHTDEVLAEAGYDTERRSPRCAQRGRSRERAGAGSRDMRLARRAARKPASASSPPRPRCSRDRGFTARRSPTSPSRPASPMGSSTTTFTTRRTSSPRSSRSAGRST